MAVVDARRGRRLTPSRGGAIADVAELEMWRRSGLSMI